MWGGQKAKARKKTRINAEDTESAEDAEKREILTTIRELVGILPRSLHFAAGAPKCGAEEKTGRSGRDDREEDLKDRQECLCHWRLA
jgi:hypothetical protein